MAAPIDDFSDVHLLADVHKGALSPGPEVYTVCGGYKYFHYGCDGQDDRGWGCGYRTLQSLCSWVRHHLPPTSKSSSRKVPSIPEIQQALVLMEDKDTTFQGSRDWIGSVEVGLCLDYFFDVPCKIVHVHSGRELGSHIDTLVRHFKELGPPVMMGGDSDSSSKGVLGICTSPPALLIMDPHYYGRDVSSCDYLYNHGWVKWQLLEDFMEHSFYNLCLPQLKACHVND